MEIHGNIIDIQNANLHNLAKQTYRQVKVAVCGSAGEGESIRDDLKVLWPQAQIEMFTSSESLMAVFDQGKGYDLIFLDTALTPENGMDTGKKICEKFPETFLVFISDNRYMAADAFKLDALHYLLKPCDQVMIAEVLRRYSQRARQRAAGAMTPILRDKVPFHKILYVESAHNNLLLHLSTGAVLKIRGSISGFMEYLDSRFLRINRGIIVNMEAIEKMGSESCQIGGMTFMLSRKDRAANKRRYNEWLLQSAIGPDE